MQPIVPIQVGDNIKLAINFYNLSGLMNISSIQWRTIKFSEIPEIQIHLNPNDIASYDKNRLCEVEELYTDWKLFEYFQKPEKVRIDEFRPQLQLVETRCAGVDIVTSKLIFRASEEGTNRIFLSFLQKYLPWVAQLGTRQY